VVPLLSMISISTASRPPDSEKLCLNVYQPDCVMVCGCLPGFDGKLLFRNALLLAEITNSAAPAGDVPALKTKSRRKVSSGLLSATDQSNRQSGWV
jgi:hypothetical protein